MINIGLGSKCKAWINFLLSCCDNSGCWSTTVAITPWSNAIYTNMGCWIGEAWPNCPLFNTPTELSWWQERYRAYYHNKKQLLLLSDGKARKKRERNEKLECWAVYLLTLATSPLKHLKRFFPVSFLCGVYKNILYIFSSAFFPPISLGLSTSFSSP